MSIKIGDNNKIIKSNIAENINGCESPKPSKSIYDKHPVICGFLISLVAGIVVLFSFWENIISWIEGWF